MTIFVELVLLFGAGLIGGFINSVAGGGSFITFPALLFSGISPISANATNTFASCAGYLSGTYAFREDLRAYKKELQIIIPISLVGGAVGAWLLIKTPESVFKEIIPWLLLFATLLFIYGTRINVFFKAIGSQNKHLSIVGHFLSILILLLVCVYGGFFNAGLGIIALSYLALAGYTNINAMNGIKLLISSAVSITAIILFVMSDAIAWRAGLAVLMGTLLGGYVSAHISKNIPAEYVRRFVIVASFTITTYFFYDTYA